MDFVGFAAGSSAGRVASSLKNTYFFRRGIFRTLRWAGSLGWLTGLALTGWLVILILFAHNQPIYIPRTVVVRTPSRRCRRRPFAMARARLRYVSIQTDPKADTDWRRGGSFEVVPARRVGWRQASSIDRFQGTKGVPTLNNCNCLIEPLFFEV